MHISSQLANWVGRDFRRGEIRLSGWACILAERTPIPLSRLFVMPSSIHRAFASTRLLPRQSRQLGAKYDKLSSRIPASDGVEKYLLPERAHREHTRTYFRKPLLHPPTPRSSSTVSPWLSLPKRFLSFCLPLFGSAGTRLFAGLRYLHKSAMQSLFIFCAKVWRESTRRSVCV